MSKRKILWLSSIVALVLILAGAGYFYWFGVQSREIAAAILPRTLNLEGHGPELVNRIKECEQRIRAGQDVATALAELASLFHGNGLYSEAARCYQGMIRIDSHNARWPHLLANILAGFGRLDDAVLLWRRALSLKNDYTPAQIHLADSLLKLNRLEEARKVYDRVLQRETDNPYALLGLARIDMEAGRWGVARERLEAAVSSSDYRIGYDLLVTASEHMGDKTRAEAVRARNKASGAFIDIPDPWLRETYFDCYDSYMLSLAGGTAEAQGDVPFAINLVERAIRLEPKNGNYYVQAHLLYLQMKNTAKALHTVLNGTVEAPDCADTWHELAVYYRNVGQDQQAYMAVLTGLAHCPNSPSLHYMRGEYLVTAGKLEEAISDFQQTASIKNDDGSPHIQLARIYFSLNRTNDALNALKNGYLAEPNSPPVLTVLGFYYINAHDEVNARKWMQRIKDQPRIMSKERTELEAAFYQQFGSKPY